MTLRRRILLAVAPLLLLIGAVGVSGVWLLDNLGRRSEEIIRANYISLSAMADLNLYLADAECSALVPGGDAAGFDLAIQGALQACRVERGNITIDGEGDEALSLDLEVKMIASSGTHYFAALPEDRQEIYERRVDGLRARIQRAKGHAANIRALNETAMYDADRQARETAGASSIRLGIVVLAAILLAVLAIWRLQRIILRPIRAVTAAAAAIGGGELQQVVPVVGRDELGRLAESFNAMAAKLRTYHQLDQDRLFRARRAAQATVDSFPDPIVVLDHAGRVEFANPAASRLFGIVATEVDPPVAWRPPDSLRPAIEESVRTRRPVLCQSFQDAIVFRWGGEEHTYQPQIRPITSPEGETLGIAVVLDDVTRFRLLDQLKSDWVATVSHELKTPLTSVQLAVHILLEETIGHLEPKQIELLIEARENADRLFRLIQQLLALARLEDGRGGLVCESVEPGEVLRTAAETAQSRAEDKRLTIRVDADTGLPSVAIDATRFGQAINNLIDNAIVNTVPGGSIALTARLNDVGQVELTVGDTGIGIPPDAMPHVFERFFRVAGRDEAPGTGLGLAIVREVVEAHGGAIRCTSELGRGTTFTITLPPAKEGA